MSEYRKALFKVYTDHRYVSLKSQGLVVGGWAGEPCGGEGIMEGPDSKA